MKKFEEIEKMLNEILKGEVHIYFNMMKNYATLYYTYKGYDLVKMAIPNSVEGYSTEEIVMYLIRKIEEELIM